MVGFDPDAHVKLSTIEYGIAGSVSGVCSRAALQPLDVIKIRFQLQVEPIKKRKGKYHGMFQATRLIVREEGLSALWKGHLPAQGLSLIFGLVQFGSYEILTKNAWKYFPHQMVTEHKNATNFICGALSGALAMTASLPMDVVRTRLAAQGEPKAYPNVRIAIRTMYAKEGFVSFYRGFIPTIAQIAPYTGFQFMFYSGFAKFWNKLVHRVDYKERGTEMGPLESLICGSFSGFSAKMAVYPLDLLKKRLQVIGFEYARIGQGKTPKYKGLIHCTKCILQEEGLKGMYKGLVPSLVKAAAATGCGFFFYEQSCRILRLTHYTHSN